ncbi:conserved hypothetical protein [uncultured Gammaproteobacteria bacterium]
MIPLPLFPPGLITKIQAKGVQWLWQRIRRELRVPETRLGHGLRAFGTRIHALFRGATGWFRRLASGTAADGVNTLYLFYDLEVAPITYDFTWFLIGGELERRERNLQHLHVVFVPGPINGLRQEREDYENVMDANARRWRLNNICIPLCTLIPTCSGFTLCGTRTQAAAILAATARHVFPNGYSPTFPVVHSAQEVLDVARAGKEVRFFVTPPQGGAYLVPWLEATVKGRKLITITLRNYSYMPARNSNRAAWAAFARKLDPAEYCVVIVPDTDSALKGVASEMGEFPEFRDACWNIGLRSALYDAAWINLGVNNGTSSLCWFSPTARYITFKLVTEDVPQASTEYITSLGYEIGQNFPFAGCAQQLVWDADDASVISEAFDRVHATIPIDLTS